MEAVCIKLDQSLLRLMKQTMRQHHYATKTEFIREAIRTQIVNLEKKKALRRLEMMYGASNRRTTDAELHAARERAFKELERELK